MKLVNVELTFDTKKIIFYFTAEGRVDFRELVKDLAGVFRTRIELRQIGVRDEAKMVGGLGLCGRAVCCHSFLGEFEPVSIRMAKDQNLSLNPTKISGLCGRLMCCLQFEAETYKDALEQLPNSGDVIDTPQGQGRVTEVNPLTGEVNIEVADGVEVVLNLGDNAANCEGCSQCCAVRKQVATSDCPMVKQQGELASRPEPANPTQPAEAKIQQAPDREKSRNRRRRRPKPKNGQGQGQQPEQARGEHRPQHGPEEKK